MLCSRESFTDQSYHACIRSETNPSIRSDACMTADYARGQPASEWPLAGQPCNVDCDLHTIARAHNRPFDCSPIGTLGPRVAAVEWPIMCTPIMHSTRSKLMPKWHFFLSSSPASQRARLASRQLAWQPPIWSLSAVAPEGVCKQN